MGVRQLQAFIQKYVPKGYVEISLIDECKSFKVNNNLRPILLIDLMSVLGPLVKSQKELHCGFRHNEIYNNFEKLLQKLSEIADLVFFEDGDHLVTMEYNREALRKHLNLNDQEMILMSTLNGNDVINYNDTFHFHKKLIHQRNDPSKRFPAISSFIKSNKLIESGNLYSNVAVQLFGSSTHGYVKKVKQSFELYDVKFEIPEIHDRILKFCREKSYDFIFSIRSHMPTTFSLGYFDIRKMDRYTDRTLCTFRKQIGIILSIEDQLNPHKVYAKMSHNDIFREFTVEPTVPKIQIPSLMELWSRSEYPEHDNIRFNLLKWLICEKNKDQEDIQLDQIPQNIFVDILVLIYMVNEGFIDSATADIIMLSIKQVNESTVPKNLHPPENVHPKAFPIAFLFTKIFMLIERCLEVTGLKDRVKLINFDGVLFHNLFMEYNNQDFDHESLLGDMSIYRYYA